nr:hypothetical protein [Micromonospora sp. DSM 115978]
MAVRQLTLVSLSAAVLLAGALTGSAAATSTPTTTPEPAPPTAPTTTEAPESAPVAGAVALAAASCDSAWWTATSATVETWVPTKNWTGDANCVLGQGSNSWGVAALQNVLRQCYGQNIALDAVFGP